MLSKKARLRLNSRVLNLSKRSEDRASLQEAKIFSGLLKVAVWLSLRNLIIERIYNLWIRAKKRYCSHLLGSITSYK